MINIAGAEVARFKYFQSWMKYPRRATRHIPTVQKFQTKIPASARFFGPTNSVMRIKIQFNAPPVI